METTTVSSHVTLRHFEEYRWLFSSVFMPAVRRVCDDAGLFSCGVPREPEVCWHGQRLGQEPERDGREQGDGSCYDEAQPPGPHPAGISRGDRDAV